MAQDDTPSPAAASAATTDERIIIRTGRPLWQKIAMVLGGLVLLLTSAKDKNGKSEHTHNAKLADTEHDEFSMSLSYEPIFTSDAITLALAAHVFAKASPCIISI